MLETDAIADRANWSARALAVFRHPNYRLYIIGLVVSQVGTWMQYTAQGLLVYRLTHSPLALGLVGFLPMIPLVPLTVVSSVLADRLPRRKLLLWVQYASIFPPLALAALTWSGAVEIWHIVVIEVLMQGLAALDLPARQAMIVDTVDLNDLDTAVAVSTSGFNTARIIGPALAGVLVGLTGEAFIFALNGFSFLAVAAALLMMRLPEREMTARRRSMGANMVDGVRYLLQEPLLVAAILLSVIVGLFIMPYQRFIPVLVLDILDAGDIGVGLLNALAGLGAVLGTAVLVWMMSRWPGQRGRLGLLLGALLAFAAMGFGLSTSFWLSGLLVAVVGAGLVAVRSIAFTLVHVNVREELRGRVTGLMVLLAVSSMRVGELVVGFLAERIGTPGALMGWAVGCLAAVAALSLLTPRLRRAA
ncbi:MAG: MFS transporter [Chloroflexi bacterium]|nr:MFS transporter [Chloroflexota bacterium]